MFTGTGNLPARGHHGNPQGASHLCESGFDEWRGQRPLSIVKQVIKGIDEEHERRASIVELEDTSMGQEPKGARELGPAGPAREVLHAAATGEKQRAKTQVGPSKPGSRTLGLKAQGKKSTTQGTSIQQEHRGTLGLDLGGRARLSKPRSLGTVDEIMWGEAQQLAIQEIAVLFSVPTDIQLYYSNTCKVGQQALAAQIHIKTQSIYDARCAQKMSRERRRMK